MCEAKSGSVFNKVLYLLVCGRRRVCQTKTYYNCTDNFGDDISCVCEIELPMKISFIFELSRILDFDN